MHRAGDEILRVAVEGRVIVSDDTDFGALLAHSGAVAPPSAATKAPRGLLVIDPLGIHCCCYRCRHRAEARWRHPVAVMISVSR
jgi:hypothetical protein